VKKGVELLDYFFLLRPTLFFPVWTYFLAGQHGGAQLGTGTAEFFHAVPSVWILSAVTLLMGSVFILNQIQDVETDRMNGKQFLLVSGVISGRNAMIEAVVLCLLGLGLAFWTDLLLGIGFLTLFLLGGILYNYPPAIWKNHPILGMAVNVVGGMLIFDAGWVAGGGDQAIPPQVIAYGLGATAVFLNTTLPDMKGDAKTGKITFGVRYGIGKTAVWALAFESFTVVLSWALREWYLFVPSALVLPLFVYAAARRRLSDTVRATKFSVLALAGSVCIQFPFYLALIFGVFFLSRWYYKKRFRFDYPNFKTT
jgi:4-hydroxybenzoate polyprenyltransferase